MSNSGKRLYAWTDTCIFEASKGGITGAFCWTCRGGKEFLGAGRDSRDVK